MQLSGPLHSRLPPFAVTFFLALNIADQGSLVLPSQATPYNTIALPRPPYEYKMNDPLTEDQSISVECGGAPASSIAGTGTDGPDLASGCGFPLRRSVKRHDAIVCPSLP
jgi:hypothetical protein